MTSTNAVFSNRDNANPMETSSNSTVSSVGAKGSKITKGKTTDAVKNGSDDPPWVLALKNKMLFNEVYFVSAISRSVRYDLLCNVLLSHGATTSCYFCCTALHVI